MPQFILKEGRHFVSYITGPSHVLLGVQFSQVPVTPTLLKQPPMGSCSHGALDEEKIREAVEEVLASHRTEGANLFASEIVYVENDSPRYDLYRIAAHVLAKHYLKGGEFQRMA